MLADSLLRGWRESGALLDDAMSYVSKEDFRALVSRRWRFCARMVELKTRRKEIKIKQTKIVRDK